MRPASSLLQLALCFSSLTSITAAWPEVLPEPGVLAVRQADETTSAEEAEETGGGKQVTTRNLNTATVETESDAEEETGTGTRRNTKETGTATTKKGSKETEHETFAPNDPAGGVSMLTPATTLQPTPLFKIGDDISFAWNYTSLQGSPTAIDVLVSCSAAAETWTLTANMTFETEASYVWHSEEQENDPEAPLGVDLYTLIIKDSEADITEMPEPGYLGAYSGLKFGMYTAQPYVPLDEWTCAACNAAVSKMESHALMFASTMCVVTIVSFTWFVTGLGLH